MRFYFGGGFFLFDFLFMFFFLFDLLDLGVFWFVGFDVKNEFRFSLVFSSASVFWVVFCGRVDGRFFCGFRGRDLAMWVSFVEVLGKFFKEFSFIFFNRELSLISIY